MNSPTPSSSAAADSGTPRKFQNFIAGKWCDSVTGETYENRSPANWNDVIGTFPRSNEEDVDRAVKAARKAYKTWRLVPAADRGNIFQRMGDLMVKHKKDIAREMTREMGKVLKETMGDTQEAIDTAYYAFGESRRLFGRTVPSELPNKNCMTFRMPIGVAGLITPWNFPSAIPAWKSFPALLCGNTIVFKPASDTPATANRLVELLLEAGVPPEAVNIIHGSGRKVGIPLIEHPDVDLISFTGSSEVGRDISSRAGAKLKRVSLELGGKNPQIVLDDANLDLALEAALWGAFGTTGQRCTATSRLIVQAGVHDKFVEMLKNAANKLRCGDGLDPKTDVGPLVNEGQRDTVESYVKIGLDEGAKLVCGGERDTSPQCANGWFYRPTVFSGVTPEMRLAKEEIFGPVLSVLKVKDFDEAIAVANNVDYGLSSSIFTQDVNRAFRAMRDIEAGITYINGATIGAECHLPFGGVKDTGNGHREGGWTVYEFFSEIKTVYVDFSGTLQKAQIDNY
ncbi:aldehyde dehydrogenase family protein [bacterium]|nr:aldehyde dehydrogenase family protein [bacterium]